MFAYTVRRILWLIPVLWFVATVTFFLMHFVPGGPFDSEVTHTPATQRNLEVKYGLDKPLVEQYGRFLKNGLQGDLGISLQFQNRSVTEVIGDGVGTTATLGLLAVGYALIFGLTLGILAALNQNGFLDYISVIFATIGASVPSFVLGIFLVTIFSIKLGWTPVLGWGDPKQAILPVITLGSLSASYIARVTRAAMIDVMRQDYVRTARAKGLTERIVVIRHITRNALIPVITLAGPITAGLVTGSFIIEQFYAIPGIGRSFVQAVFARDYGMIMGTTLFYAAIVAFANLAVDLLYGVADPRIRYS
jgi:oligopeptide transport system permease protein